MNISQIRLLFVSFSFFSTNIEVLDGIRSLVSGNHTQPVTQLMLLQELLGQVLQVTLGRGDLGGAECNRVILTVNGDATFSQIVGASIHLDTVAQVLFERVHVKDLVVDRCRAVDGELIRIRTRVK